MSSIGLRPSPSHSLKWRDPPGVKNESVSGGRGRLPHCHCASHSAQERVATLMDESARNMYKGRHGPADVNLLAPETIDLQ